MAVIGKRYVKTIKDTAAALAAANEIYPNGWKIIESNTDKWKEGDGVKTYNSLPYLPENMTTFFFPDQVDEQNLSVGDPRVRILGINSSLYTQFAKQWPNQKFVAETAFVTFHDTAQLSASANPTGSTRYSWIYLEKQETIAKMGFLLRIAGTYTAAGNNSMGLYKMDFATGIATRVANSAHDVNLFKGVEHDVTEAVLTEPYVASPGWYLGSLRFEGTSVTVTPQVGGKVLANSNMFDQYGINLGHAGSSTLPSTVNMAAPSSFAGYIIWMCLLKA